jgi:hypothetical protein
MIEAIGTLALYFMFGIGTMGDEIAMTDAREIISPELIRQIEELARTENRTPAQVIADVWGRYVDENSWERLIESGQENAKRLGIKESDIDPHPEFRRDERNSMISATLDSSVYVRAFNFGVSAASLLALARAGQIRIDISKPILDKTIGVLRGKFKDPYTPSDIRQKLIAVCNFIASIVALDIVKEDAEEKYSRLRGNGAFGLQSRETKIYSGSRITR